MEKIEENDINKCEIISNVRKINTINQWVQFLYVFKSIDWIALQQRYYWNEFRKIHFDQFIIEYCENLIGCY